MNVRVKPERKKEIQKNQDKILMALNLPPTDTALFLNGMFFDLDVVDIFSILETVRQEIRIMEGLYKIGKYNDFFKFLIQIFKLISLFIR